MYAGFIFFGDSGVVARKDAASASLHAGSALWTPLRACLNRDILESLT